ncbi:Pyrimidine-specific ribonucleoside hydrolase RihA [Arthrobacter saudimassiliensis]|uniref:Pyrimidine-specific ribonucleoside hydrolase RihA n=1 Tax=Arthrobacter saudimassiliensis TaxID=1461584 RepID=A0A078MXU1_9MICC|nr:Pyrimidine-specific ribonucleoside hydrolase RihA [Arthrobacter saudimassiliensis]
MSASSSSPAAPARPTPVIADVDTGTDDALALLFLACHPGLDLRAVTCTAGNTDVDQVLRNTLDVLALAGAGDVPVARGAERPLLNEPRHAHGFHGVGGMGGLQLPRSGTAPSPLAAVELIRRTVEDSPEPVTLLGLGPLTNLALFLRTYPATARKLARIVFMGGSAGLGNASAVAEFNAWQDPEALAIVLAADVPVTMYGLDVFLQATVEPADFRALAAADDAGTALAGALLTRAARARAVDAGLSADTDRLQAVTIGDAGAACLLAKPATVTVRPFPVQVQLFGPGRGQTIVDRRAFAGEEEEHGLAGTVPVIDVAFSLDRDLMARTFLAAVGG